MKSALVTLSLVFATAAYADPAPEWWKIHFLDDDFLPDEDMNGWTTYGSQTFANPPGAGFDLWTPITNTNRDPPDEVGYAGVQVGGGLGGGFGMCKGFQDEYYPPPITKYIHVWVRCLSSDWDWVMTPNALTVRIGLDPNGGTDPGSDDIVWSDPYWGDWAMLELVLPCGEAWETIFVDVQGFNDGYAQILVDRAEAWKVIPEPATLSLLALGGLALRLRGRGHHFLPGCHVLRSALVLNCVLLLTGAANAAVVNFEWGEINGMPLPRGVTETTLAPSETAAIYVWLELEVSGIPPAPEQLGLFLYVLSCYQEPSEPPDTEIIGYSDHLTPAYRYDNGPELKVGWSYTEIVLEEGYDPIEAPREYLVSDIVIRCVSASEDWFYVANETYDIVLAAPDMLTFLPFTIGHGSANDPLHLVQIPEPGTLSLLLLGALGWRRRALSVCGRPAQGYVRGARRWWQRQHQPGRRASGLAGVAICVWAGSSALAHQAFFTGLGDLPGGSFESWAYGVSADGSTVVGVSYSAQGSEAFRWTEATGMLGLGDLPGDGFISEARGVSADGSVVVGRSWSASDFEAFRWAEQTGMVGLGGPPGEAFPREANGVSADGSVIVGATTDPQAFRWTGAEGVVTLGGGTARDVSANGSVIVGGAPAFRWTAEHGMVGLGPGTAYGVSADGSVIVGVSVGEPFRWTEATGMVSLGGPYGAAYGVSADGSVVVGEGSDGAFIWDATNGMRDLRDVLVNDFGLDLTGWALVSAQGVSGDGLTIVGWGEYAYSSFPPAVRVEAWIAHIPEPATLSLLAPGGLALIRRRR